MRSAITRRRLTDFRSYVVAELEPAGRTVFLYGPNGAGKTNLLEAVSLLTPGRGLRNAALPELGRREPGEAPARPGSLSAIGAHDEEEVRLGTGVEAPGSARRLVRIEGETTQPGR